MSKKSRRKARRERGVSTPFELAWRRASEIPNIEWDHMIPILEPQIYQEFGKPRLATAMMQYLMGGSQIISFEDYANYFLGPLFLRTLARSVPMRILGLTQEDLVRILTRSGPDGEDIMGTNIYVKTEVRDDMGPWREDGPNWEAIYLEMHKGKVHIKHNQMWDYRYYDAFACLAGHPDRKPINPIVPPREMPDDLSPTVLEAVKKKDKDLWARGSWFTLAELLMHFDYDVPCLKTICKKDEIGRLITVYTNSTYREILNDNILKDVEILRNWAEKKDIEPENVRIVFWFDQI